MKENNFCYHPWVGIDISPQGDFRPCCKYDQIIAKNLDDYLTSDHLLKLKEDFLNGIKPSGCLRCWNDESAGIPSKRQIDYKYVFNEQTPDLNKFKVLSFPFGNTCNLSCRTCNSFASSKWSHYERKLKKSAVDVKQIYSHQKFYKDSDFIADIKNISEDLIDITFPGGEPFITGINEQLNYLDFLIERNAKNISLTYITNITTFPSDEFWRRWKKFKHVNIQMSIDGISDHFEYIRWPANWAECHNNVKKYQSAQKQYSNIQLSISHTVSVFNIFYLPEFFAWCYKEQLPEPYLGMVEFPVQYNVQVLPNDVKNKIVSKLLTAKFNNVVNFLMAKNTNSFTTTQEWIRALDAQRSQNFNQVFPELKEYLI